VTLAKLDAHRYASSKVNGIAANDTVGMRISKHLCPIFELAGTETELSLNYNDTKRWFIESERWHKTKGGGNVTLIMFESSVAGLRAEWHRGCD